MHFFVDETGSFSGWERFPSISLLGALIVPDERLGKLEKAYKRLRSRLPQVNGEVKGRLLDEAQVKAVIEMLFHHSAIFEAIGIDLGTHSQATVVEYQRRVAKYITANLSSDLPQSIIDRAWTWRQQYEELSLPLVIQTELTFRLAKRLINHGTMYFSQRRPEELAHFHWVIDAKGDQHTPTKWEQWWCEFVMPWLQHGAVDDPFMMLPIGDYSHMKRFEGELSPFWQSMVPPSNRDAPAIRLERIMGESIRFSSAPEPGLELVDIVTNATRRALVGNIGKTGWIHIPRLMIHVSDDPHYIEMVTFRNDEQGKYERPYGDVLLAFSGTGRVMRMKGKKLPKQQP
ncbi:hypothetical protein IVB55_05740 [Bradyrhizobium sp. CW4]|uniref:hypothetical protein n=1 Tax=Bradyrhizobium sp. CW4 TaxID=2782687 RepID=UPI001FFBBBC7|nr:hypothetical protein [Bradyrhizobium sp. CW4]MCK1412531.1 hypothetical protein [Bradyrhizobium sp. CW4]